MNIKEKFEELVEKYSAEELPLKFYSFAGVGAFPIVNGCEQDLRISQIILKGNDGAATPANMYVKGYVNPYALSAAKYEYYADSAKYIPSAAVTLLEAAKKAGTTADAEAVAATYTAAQNTILNAQAATTGKDAVQSGYITLDCKNYLLKEGASVTAYMMVPAGMTNMSVEIMVVDEDGESWSVYVDDSGSSNHVKVNNMSSIKTKRDKTNAIFGKTTDNKSMKSVKILDKNLLENTGYYVDSKTALIELLDNNLGTIKVHNSGDWAIDAEVVNAMLNYSGAGISFSNPIKIKSSTALTDAKDLALSGATFADLTVVGTEYAADGTTVTFAGTTADLNVTVTGTLTVEAGANVNIIGGEYKNIVNKGILSVGKSATINATFSRTTGTTTNKAGTITLYKDAAVKAEAGDVVFKAYEDDEDNAFVVNSAITLTAGADLEIGQYVTYKPASGWTVPVKTTAPKATSKLVNYGTIAAGDNVMKINGSFENNGKVTSKVQVAGSLTNAAGAEMKNNVAIEPDATVTNNGVIEKLYLSGLLTTGADSETTIEGVQATGNYGKINNTAKGALVEGTNGDFDKTEIYYNFAGTVAELEAVPFAWYNINTLRVNGTLSFSRGFDMANTAAVAQMTNLKKLVLADEAVINVQTDKVVATFDEIVAEGCATIKGIKDVSELIIVTTLSTNTNIPTTIYNEAVASTSTTKNGHTLSVKYVEVSAVKEVSGSQSPVKFGIKAVNEELDSDEKNIPALVNINGGALSYEVVPGATADKAWQVSVDGATPVNAQ